MRLLKKYARREPTTDPILKKYAPESKRTDVVFYEDPECTKLYCRWVWHHRPPTRRRRTVILNCFRWEIVWVTERQAA